MDPSEWNELVAIAERHRETARRLVAETARRREELRRTLVRASTIRRGEWPMPFDVRELSERWPAATTKPLRDAGE